jgi:acetyl-CoA carboxylase carboxyltransferase component
MNDPGGDRTDWTPEVEEIRRRRELARAMGGPEKVARQHASGRRTVRERIDLLADPGSFADGPARRPAVRRSGSACRT